jgi:hypothetical protein
MFLQSPFLTKWYPGSDCNFLANVTDVGYQPCSPIEQSCLICLAVSICTGLQDRGIGCQGTHSARWDGGSSTLLQLLMSVVNVIRKVEFENTALGG